MSFSCRHICLINAISTDLYNLHLNSTHTEPEFLYKEHVFIGKRLIQQVHRCTLSQVKRAGNYLEAGNWSLVSSAEDRWRGRDLEGEKADWSASSSGSEWYSVLRLLLLLLRLVVLQVSQYPAGWNQDGNKKGCHSYCLLLRDKHTQTRDCWIYISQMSWQHMRLLWLL